MCAARLPLLLSASRLVLAPLFFASMPDPDGAAAWASGAPVHAARLLPLATALLAAATDFVDGRLARRTGSASAAGAVLDVAGDAAFVLFALSALARVGVVVVALPAAAAIALAAFAWSRRPGAARPSRAVEEMGRRGAADVLGHAAGVLNYAIVLAGSAIPLVPAAAPWIRAASVVVAAANLAPLVARLARAARPPGPGRPDQESPRSSSVASPPRERA